METVGPSIDPRTHLGATTLAVRDAERSLQFYRELLGFELLGRDNGTLRLGAGGQHLLTLEASPEWRPRPRPSTGLYHVAILLPSRAELARVLRRLIDARIELGASDHAVSEALYISDPDGNGLEIYRDRPRDEWRWDGSQVRMTIDPLDAAGILAELPPEPSGVLPRGTTIGHMHLQVADIPTAARFYRDVLGFALTAAFPGALFLSAGGYHHHLGLNTWETRGAPQPPPTATGLRSFEIVLPDRDALQQVVERLQAAGTSTMPGRAGIQVSDPWNNRVVLTMLNAES